ncbi:MAG: DUF4256 domain-containing protein [Solitalea-like symbiont of Acarus siro]
MNTDKELSQYDYESLIQKLNTRFLANMHRHRDLDFNSIINKLKSNNDKMWSLNEMEISGGEPDIVKYDVDKDEYIFYDFSKESPKGRRGLCYDRKALDTRKEHRPENSAIDLAKSMGVEILTEQEYRYLQTLGEFDTKTSSWIITPDKIRALGGAIFGDYRYSSVFIYHNGASSYYSSRGFRASLRV